LAVAEPPTVARPSDWIDYFFGTSIGGCAVLENNRQVTVSDDSPD
jgi:hypothetical protein